MKLRSIQLTTMGAALAALAMLATPAAGQGTRRDTVSLVSGQRLTGKVLKDSLKGVELDKDLDGQGDAVYPMKEVRSVEYGDTPRWLLDAYLDKGKVEKRAQYVEKLKQAYTDETTSKWILQYAYYEIGRTYEEMAKTDDRSIAEAMTAYEKLLSDVPETRFAVQARLNVAEIFLYRGQFGEARQKLQEVVGKGYGKDAEIQANMMAARTRLLDSEGDEAQKLLGEIKDEQVTDAGLKQELEVLRADAQTMRREYEPAYQRLVKVLGQTAGTPEAPVRAEAYAVLGDLFKERGRCEEAMLAYLRVQYMYPESDAMTRARVLVGAAQCEMKLNQLEKARDFRAKVRQQYPGSFWEKKLKEE